MKTNYLTLNEKDVIYTELESILADRLFRYDKKWLQADLVGRVKFLIDKCRELESEVTRGCSSVLDDTSFEDEDTSFGDDVNTQRDIQGICTSCGGVRAKMRDYDHGCGNVCFSCS